MDATLVYGLTGGFIMATAVFCLWRWKVWCTAGVPTHEGGLHLDDQVTQVRIYSSETSKRILLTIKLDSLVSEQFRGRVEILVNGAAITDGLIEKWGYTSRTYLLENVTELDIVNRWLVYTVTGQYQISVPL
jgi:hypothetical protein